MIIFTDRVHFAEKYISDVPDWRPASLSDFEEPVQRLARLLIPGPVIYSSEIESLLSWRYLFLVEYAENSQYDMLIRVAREYSNLPHGILCAAGAGKKFHGFHDRSWAAFPGNLHLSAYFAPRQPIADFGPGFMVLAAVSVLHALDSFPALRDRAMIKWVNDILLEEGKVGGVLSHTQAVSRLVTCAVIGIGLNIETAPPLEPTPYVPRTGALRGYIRDRAVCNERIVFQKLLETLDAYYKTLAEGGYGQLLAVYRNRSLVIGREASIRSDEKTDESREIIRGRVVGIGDNLELYFEGHPAPVTKGRLILES